MVDQSVKNTAPPKLRQSFVTDSYKIGDLVKLKDPQNWDANLQCLVEMEYLGTAGYYVPKREISSTSAASWYVYVSLGEYLYSILLVIEDQGGMLVVLIGERFVAINKKYLKGVHRA